MIATKGGLERPGPNHWARNCRPDRLRRCCEASLKRLRLERIDLYQLHAVDPKVPIEDSIGALAELQEEGKIRHIGVSNVGLEDLERAQQIVQVVSVQNHYNVLDRASEDVLQECARQQLAFFPWAPIASGSDVARQRPGDRRDRARPRRDRATGGARMAARPLAGDPADSRARARSRTSTRTSRPPSSSSSPKSSRCSTSSRRPPTSRRGRRLSPENQREALLERVAQALAHGTFLEALDERRQEPSITSRLATSSRSPRERR